jgi:protein pelota
MKLINFDKKQGVLKVLPENVDDVWTLGQVLDSGDVIASKTTRKIKLEGDRKNEVVKKTVFLKLEVERAEFSEGALRISGKIVDGPEDIPRGQYHTITSEPQTDLEITKQRWLSYQMQRVEEAAQAEPPKILVCVFDRDESTFARMTKAGYEVVLRMKGDVQKKQFDNQGSGNFYDDIIKQLSEYSDRFGIDKVILASPAFWKDELMKRLKNPVLKKQIILGTVSTADENGVKEALKRPETREALRQERTAKEIQLVEDVLTGISKGSAVAYGNDEVVNAAQAGAVSKLLVSEAMISKLREEQNFEGLEQTMHAVDDSQGDIVIISKSHDGGKKLDGLGGIAAILRYRLS